MEFKDKTNGNVLLIGELPSGFKTEAELKNITYQSNMSLKLSAHAQKENCNIYYQTGDSFICQKKTFNGLTNPLGSQDPSGNYYAYPNDLKSALDQLAAQVAKAEVSNVAYYDVPPQLTQRLNEKFAEYQQYLVEDLQRNASLMPIPIAFVIRNYLFDGGLAVYKNDKQTVAVFLCRFGVELDTANGQGIYENLSNTAFGQAPLDYNSIEASANWQIPYCCYMISDKEEDVGVFMKFVETVDQSQLLKDYVRKLSDQLRQQNYEAAQKQAMQDQVMFQSALAEQNAKWDRVQSFGQSLSQDLDAWRIGQAQMRTQSDQRFTPSGMESSDDRIQRLRHESIMGVETYDRNDGTTVEYDNTADRVFENNLDSTSQFGTRNYYDSYIPEGWHELKKK